MHRLTLFKAFILSLALDTYAMPLAEKVRILMALGEFDLMTSLHLGKKGLQC